MRHTGFRAYVSVPLVPKLPLGLVELLEGLAKDVLKNNPGEEEMYKFCANHMKKLLEIRDGKEPKRTKMTLEEKIEMVQEEVRKLAEKRRQESAIDSFPSENTSEMSTDIAKTGSIEEQASVVENLASPIKPVMEGEIGTDLDETNTNTLQLVEQSKEEVPSSEHNEIELKIPLDNIDGTEVIENVKIISDDLTEPPSSSSNDMNEIGNIVDPEMCNTDKFKSEVPPNTNEHMCESDDTSITEKQLEVNITTNNTTNLVKGDISSNNVDNTRDNCLDKCEKKVKEEKHDDIKTNVGSNKRQLSDEPGSYETKNATEITLSTKNIPSYSSLTTSVGINNPNEQNFKCDDSNPEGTDSDSGMDAVKLETDTTELRFKPQSIDKMMLQNKEYLLISKSAYKEDEVELEPGNGTQNDKEGNPPQISADIITDNTLDDIDSNSETMTELDIKSEDEEKSEKQHGMDLETAAVTIQKLFRSYLFKSRASTLDDLSNEEDSADMMYQIEEQTSEESGRKRDEELNAIKERRAAGLTRMDTVLQTVNEEKSLSVSTDDSSTLSSAATIIQAHVRGFLVRNRRHSNKTVSTTSLVNSAATSVSLDGDSDPHKGKTVLNIHIVPEVVNFVARDESITSIELPFDGSPVTSTGNLHPLSYDVSERRKQLKREDAIQSMSPPSNNSGKLSEDVESLRDGSLTENGKTVAESEVLVNEIEEPIDESLSDTTPSHSVTVKTVIEVNLKEIGADKPGDECEVNIPNSDENDVVTPHSEEQRSPTLSDATSNLVHSGEFHDVVLPTHVSRGKSTTVREFQAVLVYFVLWKQTPS